LIDAIEKRFLEDLGATLIQNEGGKRKFDSKSQLIVVFQQHARDFFVRSRPSKFVVVIGLGRGIFGKMLGNPFGRQHKGVAILS
jgi:hypothetical protein